MAVVHHRHLTLYRSLLPDCVPGSDSWDATYSLDTPPNKPLVIFPDSNTC